MASRRRQVEGKQQHAEGMHGDLTHEAILQQLKHKLTADNANTNGDGADVEAKGSNGSLKATAAPGPDGKHRLFEHRKQHDEADRSSEKTRVARKTRHTPGAKK